MRKKISMLLAVLMLATMLVTVPAMANTTEIPNLAEDFEIDFTATNAAEVIRGLGMNIGTATVDANGILLSTTGDKSHTLNIPNRTSGKYVVETTIKFDSKPDAQFRVKGDTSYTQNLLFGYDKNTGEGVVFTQNATGPVKVTSFDLSQEQVLTMVLDIDNNAYELYVNGTKMTLAYAKLYRDDNIQQFDWFGRANNVMHIKNLKMYKAPDLSGDFELDFTASNATNIIRSLGMNIGTATVDANGILLSTTGDKSHILNIPNRTTGKYVVETTIKFDSNPDAQFRVKGDTGYTQNLLFGYDKNTGEGVVFTQNATAPVKVTSFDLSQEQVLTMVLDLDNNAYELYVNGTKMTLAYAKLYRDDNIQQFDWFGRANNVMHIKNLKMYKAPDLSGDFELDFTASNATNIIRSLGMNIGTATVDANGILLSTTGDKSHILNIPNRTSGKYAVETTIKFDSIPDAQFRVKGDTGSAQNLLFGYDKNTGEGVIFTQNATAPVKVTSFDLSQDQVLTMVFDLDNNAYALYVNGTKMTLAYAKLFRDDNIQQFDWFGRANNVMHVKNLKVSEYVDPLQGDFELDFTASNAAEVVKEFAVPGTLTENGLYFAPSANTYYELKIPKRTTGKYLVESTLKVEKVDGVNANVYFAALGDDGKYAQRVAFGGKDNVNGSLHSTGASGFVSAASYDISKDVNVKMILDLDNNSFALYLNGKQVTLSYPHLAGATNIQALQWVVFAKNKAYFKKFIVREIKAGDSIVYFNVGENGTTTDETAFVLANGTVPTAPTVVANDTWVFKGWDKDVVAANGDAVYTAQYAKLIKVTFNPGENGTFGEDDILEYTYEQGNVIPGFPTVTPKPGYVFTGSWIATNRDNAVINFAFLSTNKWSIDLELVPQYEAVNYVATVNGEGYTTFADALAAAEDGSVITLLADVTVDEIVKLEKAVTLDLGGFVLTSTARKAIEVYADATIKNGTVTGVERAVDTRKAVTLNLENVDLVTTSTTVNTQPLTIGGSENGTVVNVKDSTIDAGKIGYGIITFVESDINVENTEINGYAALYFKEGSAGTTADVDSASVINAGGVAGERFGAIVTEETDITVTVEGTVNMEEVAGAENMAIVFKGDAANNAIALNGAVTGAIIDTYTEGATVTTTNAEVAEAIKGAGFTVKEENGVYTVVETPVITTPYKDILTLRAQGVSVDEGKKQITVTIDRYKFNLASSTYGIAIVPNDGETVDITYNHDNGTAGTQIFKKFSTDKYSAYVAGVNNENGGGVYGSQPLYIIDRANGTRVYLDVAITKADGSVETYEIIVKQADLAVEGDVDITEVLPLRADAETVVIDNDAKTIYLESSTAYTSAGLAVAVDNGLGFATRPRRLVTAKSGQNLAHGEIKDNTALQNRFDRYVVAKLSAGVEQTFQIKVQGGEDGLTYTWYTVTIKFNRAYAGDIEFTDLLNKNADEVVFDDENNIITVNYSGASAAIAPVAISGARVYVSGGIATTVDGVKGVAVKAENGAQQTAEITLKIGNDTTVYTVNFNYVG